MRLDVYHHIVLSGCDMEVINHKLDFLIGRINIMPTSAELQAAVEQAVQKERDEHTAAVTKAVQDALANAPENISQATMDAVVAAIAGTVDAPAAPVPPVE